MCFETSDVSGFEGSTRIKQHHEAVGVGGARNERVQPKTFHLPRWNEVDAAGMRRNNKRALSCSLRIGGAEL